MAERPQFGSNQPELEGQQRIVKDTVQCEEFPISPEERFDAVISSLQTPPKQILMLLLRDYPQTAWELGLDFKDAIREQIEWQTPDRTHLNRSLNYCQKTLIPIGMVAEEAFFYSGEIARESVGFSATEAGQQYGKPIAAYLLTSAYQDAQSGRRYLWHALGPTGSSGPSRAPIVRSRLLFSLASQEGTTSSIVGLTEELQISQIDSNTIGDNLHVLHKHGLVNLESVSGHKGKWTAYKRTEQGFDEESISRIVRDKKYGISKGVLLSILNTLEGEEFLDGQIIYEKSDYNEHNTYVALGLLRRAGLVEPFMFYGGPHESLRSKVKITKDGMRLAQHISKVYSAFIHEDVLNEMRSLEKGLVHNNSVFRTVASTAVTEWLPYSKVKRTKSSAENKQRIINLVQDRGTIHPIDLQELDIPDNYLTGLVKEGVLTREKKGYATFYRLAEIE